MFWAGSVPDDLTGILVFFQGSSEWSGGSAEARREWLLTPALACPILLMQVRTRL